MHHVVMYSGGVWSWGAAKRLVERGIDRADITLLFTDTRMEDEDLYRFLDEGVAVLGLTVAKIAEGRTPWEVFHDRRYLGNSRIDTCSETLKRNMSVRWVKQHHPDPASVTLYLGIDWTEAHRIERAAERWAPYRMEAPLCERPYTSKVELLDAPRAAGVEPPRLYALGFPHNNCGGFCIKAGKAHFALLLRTMPERYRYHEAKEQELRDYLGKNVTILKRQENNRTVYLTLRELRERLEASGLDKQEQFDFGGCGCFL